MPAVSKKQQMVMAIAKHNPRKLFKRNTGLKKMSKKELDDFASTPRKGLPEKKESVEDFIKRRNKKKAKRR